MVEGIIGDFGELSVGILTRFSAVAMSNIALYVLSPAFKSGTSIFGGYLNMEIMSVAVCFRKSSDVTEGKGMSCGKKVTVSDILSCLVFGI